MSEESYWNLFSSMSIKESLEVPWPPPLRQEYLYEMVKLYTCVSLTLNATSLPCEVVPIHLPLVVAPDAGSVSEIVPLVSYIPESQTRGDLQFGRLSSAVFFVS